MMGSIAALSLSDKGNSSLPKRGRGEWLSSRWMSKYSYNSIHGKTYMDAFFILTKITLVCYGDCTIGKRKGGEECGCRSKERKKEKKDVELGERGTE